MATEKNNIGVIHQDGCVEIMKQDGPGIWFGFHVTSLETRDSTTQLNSIRNIKLMINKLRCLKAKNVHCHLTGNQTYSGFHTYISQFFYAGHPFLGKGLFHEGCRHRLIPRDIICQNIRNRPLKIL